MSELGIEKLTTAEVEQSPREMAIEELANKFGDTPEENSASASVILDIVNPEKTLTVGQAAEERRKYSEIEGVEPYDLSKLDLAYSKMHETWRGRHSDVASELDVPFGQLSDEAQAHYKEQWGTMVGLAKKDLTVADKKIFYGGNGRQTELGYAVNKYGMPLTEVPDGAAINETYKSLYGEDYADSAVEASIEQDVVTAKKHRRFGLRALQQAIRRK